MTHAAESRPVFTIKPGAKAAVTTTVIGLVALGLFVAAVAIYVKDSGKWSGSLALAGIGLLLVLWCVYEARGFLFTEQYFADRVERVRGGAVQDQIKFADGFRFSYAVRADGADRLLTIRGTGKASFTVLTMRKPGQPPTSAEPSVDQVEAYRDHLADVVAAQIAQALSGSGTFQLDRKWTITPIGIDFDGQTVPWAELDVEVEDSTGDVRINRAGAVLGSLSMMSDNVLGVVRFLAERVPVR